MPARCAVCGRLRGAAQLGHRRLVVLRGGARSSRRQRRVEHVDHAGTNLAVEQTALLEAGLDVGRGQRGDRAPAHAGGEACQRPHRASRWPRQISSNVGRRPLPERLIGVRLGQVEREGGAVVNRDRAPQRAGRTDRENGCWRGTDRGSRRSCAGAAGPPRSAPGGCRAAWPRRARAARSQARSLQIAAVRDRAAGIARVYAR